MILSLAAVACAKADSIPAIGSRLMEVSDPMLYVPSLSFGNPALMSRAADVSLSTVGAEAEISHRSDEPELGTGSNSWRLRAGTYLHMGNLTVWGDASYKNELTRDVLYNEAADIDIIYPYITADSVGGDINSEHYGFGGGCAIAGETWGWGASAHYSAAQHYRNVDPRPRNITGLLDLSLGGGHKLWSDYIGAVSANLRRYTQSSDIDFKSEMGVEKIYHLTGLGNHYARFAGLGLSSHYSGYGYGASANLFPSSRRGLALSVEVSRFTFSKQLTDLNNLPLADAWHRRLRAQASWLAPSDNLDWAVSGNLDISRRHGSENIFGDASSNIYPQIGSLEMYADNSRNASLSALISHHSGQSRLWLRASGGYLHRREVYAAPYSTRLSAGPYGGATIGYAHLSSRLMYRGDLSLFSALRGTGCAASAGAHYTLMPGRALGLYIRYIHLSAYRCLDLSLTLVF